MKQVIGADGANSRIAKEIDAGEYDYAIAFQERIRIPEDKMAYFRDLAEMYVGDDVSPDFYGWVFPKYDHVAVGKLYSFLFLFLGCDFGVLFYPLGFLNGARACASDASFGKSIHSLTFSPLSLSFLSLTLQEPAPLSTRPRSSSTSRPRATAPQSRPRAGRLSVSRRTRSRSTLARAA